MPSLNFLVILLIGFSQIAYGNGIPIKLEMDPPLVLRVKAVINADAAPGSAKKVITVKESVAIVSGSTGFLLTSYRNLVDPTTGELSQAIEVEIVESGKTNIFEASIVGVEPTINIAVLKIEAGKKLSACKIVYGIGTQSGDVVYAVGKIENGIPEIIRGKISKLNRMECYQENLSATHIEAQFSATDLVVGSPVFNTKGEVLALYTGYMPPTHSVLEGDEVVHLLPISLAYNIYGALTTKKSFKSPWTGFSVRPLTTDEQTIFPIDKKIKGGMGIDYVWENSPAEKLGIRKDDILVRFGYYYISSAAEFQKWLYMYGVGSPVRMTLIRNKAQTLTYRYTIAERPDWAKPR